MIADAITHGFACAIIGVVRTSASGNITARIYRGGSGTVTVRQDATFMKVTEIQ